MMFWDTQWFFSSPHFPLPHSGSCRDAVKPLHLPLVAAFVGPEDRYRGDPWRLSPHEMADIWNVHSRIDVELFRLLLVGYDPEEAFFVINGLLYGFSMGVDLDGELPPECLWKDSLLTPEAHARIFENFELERRAGRIFGPFNVPPHGKHWKGAVVFPIHEVVKASGGYRTIYNLSAGGIRKSINGFVPKAARTTDYPTFRKVAASLLAIGLDRVHMAMFDCEQAYRQLSLDPANWKFSIIAWRDADGNRCYYIDTALVFGGAANPQIFNRVGDAIVFILEALCFDFPSSRFVIPGEAVMQLILRYLDDFLVLGASAHATDALLDAMLRVMDALNFPVKASKTLRAAVSRKFLGYLWLPRLDTVTIDPVRWHNLEVFLRQVYDWTIGGSVNAANISKAAGLLVWVGRVVPGSTTFIRGLHRVLQLLGATSLPAPQARLIVIYDSFLVSEILHDISWWLELCDDFNRRGCVPRGLRISEIITPRIFLPADCALVVNTDASELGIAGWWNGRDCPGTRWLYAPLPPGITLSWTRERRLGLSPDAISVSSGYCEAAAVLGTLLTFLPIFAIENACRPPGVGVWVWTDSTNVVDMWNFKSPSATMLPYLRYFSYLEATYNIRLHIHHIDGHLNCTADSISRTQWSLFRRLQPAATPQPLPLPLGVQLYL